MTKKLTAKVIASLLSIVATSSFSAPARSASAMSGTISDITIEGGNWARIALNGSPPGGRPACHNAAFTVHYGIDISTAKGKALISSLQASQLAKRQISVTGGNFCLTINGINGNITLEALQTLTIFTG
jgi:hypothetical protein